MFPDGGIARLRTHGIVATPGYFYLRLILLYDCRPGYFFLFKGFILIFSCSWQSLDWRYRYLMMMKLFLPIDELPHHRILYNTCVGYFCMTVPWQEALVHFFQEI